MIFAVGAKNHVYCPENDIIYQHDPVGLLRRLSYRQSSTRVYIR